MGKILFFMVEIWGSGILIFGRIMRKSDWEKVL